jgi:hypothetical protein
MYHSSMRKNLEAVEAQLITHSLVISVAEDVQRSYLIVQ